MSAEHIDTIREAWNQRPATQSLRAFDEQLADKLGCAHSTIARLRKKAGLRLPARATRPHLIARRITALETIPVETLRVARQLKDTPDEELEAAISSRADPTALRVQLHRGALLNVAALDRARIARGMSHGNLAAEAGLSRMTVWRLRQRDPGSTPQRPSLDTVVALAKALSCDPMELLEDPC